LIKNNLIYLYMIRFGLIGNNHNLMKLTSKHLIYKHKFSNYNYNNLSTYGLYVYPFVNSKEKYIKLKNLNFVFISLDNDIDSHNIPYDYKIDINQNLHKILFDLDNIIDKHIFNELV